MLKRIALWADGRMDELQAINESQAVIADTFLRSVYGDGASTVNPFERMQRRAMRRAKFAANVFDAVTLGGLLGRRLNDGFHYEDANGWTSVKLDA